MYNQQSQKSPPNTWHNQFPRFNSSYYSRKTNEQLEDLIRSSQKQYAVMLQLEELNKEIENQKNVINESASSEKQLNQLTLLFEELFLQQKNSAMEKLQQEDKIRMYEEYIKHKRTQIDHIDTKKYEGMVVDLAEFEKQLKIQASLKQKEEKLENQILRSDPFAFRDEQKQYLSRLSSELKQCQKKYESLKKQFQVIQLQQSIEKSTLALEIGKIQELERDHKEKQGKLKSLQRHLEQIKERIEAMLKEKKVLKKKGKDISAKAQIKEVEAEKKILEEQIAKINLEILKLQQSVENGHTIQKLEALQKQLKIMKQKQLQIYKQMKRLPNRSEQLHNLRQEYEAGKKYRKKKIQKSQKRVKTMEGLLEEKKKEIIQLTKHKEKLNQELEGFQQELRKIKNQILETEAQCMSKSVAEKQQVNQITIEKITSEVVDGTKTEKQLEKSEDKSSKVQKSDYLLYFIGLLIVFLLFLVVFFI